MFPEPNVQNKAGLKRVCVFINKDLLFWCSLGGVADRPPPIPLRTDLGWLAANHCPRLLREPEPGA